MCKKHKSYKAIRPPRTDCLDCWLQFAERQPDYPLSMKHFALLLKQLHETESAANSAKGAAAASLYVANLQR